MRILNLVSAACSTIGRNFYSRVARYITATAILTSILAAPSFGQNQISTRSTLSFTNGTIPDRVPGDPQCNTQFISSFGFIGVYGTIKDMDVTVAVTHPQRSDLRVQLRPNTGLLPTITLMDGVGGTADNLNVRFDDGAPTDISSHTSSPDLPTNTVGTNGNFRPLPGPLSTFTNRVPSSGYSLFICDLFTGFSGTVHHAYLDITRYVADLSLTKTIIDNPTPRIGEIVTYELIVTNSSTSEIAANNVAVRDTLSPGLTFVDATPEVGSYTSSTGIWSVGLLPIGASRKLTLRVSVNGTATPSSIINDSAEIANSSEVDNDSTPNNGITTEDDYASVSLTILNSPGTPPDLTNNVCRPANVGTTLLNWDNYVWPGGSLGQTIPVPNIGNVVFAIATNPPGGFATPVTNNATNMGGLGFGGVSLLQHLRVPVGGHTTTTTITLPTAVAGAQFRIFDVDNTPNLANDRIIVTGSFNGINSPVILTNGVTNIVSGNMANGFAPSAASSADGNLVATFSGPVDRIIITYQGINPLGTFSGQAESVSLHDILFCEPATSISVTTTNNVITDPVNGTTNAKAIPGSTVLYCMTISNNGIGTANNVVATEPLSTNIRHISDRLMSGPDCVNATTAEDEDPLDGPGGEPDGIGAGFLGETLRVIIFTLGPGDSRAVTYEAIVQ